MDAVYHLFHVGVAARKFLWVNLPIALDRLPAVIERYPAEAELVDDGKGSVNLLRLKAAAITPGAPDRLESLRRRLRKPHSLRHHNPAIFAQRQIGRASCRERV